jgi:hypothetical protein
VGCLSGLVIDGDAAAETKITYLDLAPVESNEDVGRLQVSVDNMAGMHMHQPEQHLCSKAPNLLVCENYSLRVYQSV